MIPELGFLFLILGFSISTFYIIFNTYHFYRFHNFLISSEVVYLFFAAVLVSFICLELSFILDDFSVLYVANNSNENLPTYFKFAALWGGHEGSMLLYLLFLSLWILVFFLNSKSNFAIYFLFIIFSLFSGFVIFTSNPFERLLPFPPEGGLDLNPLLQDFAFTIHPPTLYLGYTALTLPFAIALARCIDKGYTNWAHDLRNWSVLAWSFLTLGIALGSWWAYYELGWGGWWFWDPVENSSLIPWLIATALIHSAIATSKRNIFSNWTVLLSIGAILSSYIGLFLVRSGIVTSVHTFALDPERGLILLFIIIAVLLLSLGVFSRTKIQDNTNSNYLLLSKEFFFLINNVLLIILALAILFGTIYPIIYEIFSGGKDISVGKPYFDSVTVPIAFILAMFQGFGILTSWSSSSQMNKATIGFYFLGIILLSGLLSFIFKNYISFAILLTYLMMGAIFIGLIIYSFLQYQQTKKIKSLNISMLLSHFGIATMILGIGLVSSLQSQKELIAYKDEPFQIGKYSILFKNESKNNSKNFISDEVNFRVNDSRNEFNLMAEKRYYPVSKSVMTEAAIKPSIKEDLYISIGDKVEDGWVVKAQVKPFIRLIWLGALIMGIGGMFGILSRKFL